MQLDMLLYVFANRVEAYQGSESRMRQHIIAAWKHAHHTPEVYISLESGPGQDAQINWGEAVAVIAGERQVVHVFVMRLYYSRRTFVIKKRKHHGIRLRSLVICSIRVSGK